MKFLLLGLVVLLGVLAFLNPSPDAFEAFARERTRDVVSENAREAGGGVFGNLAGALAGEVAGAMAGGAVVRHNYVVFSTYTLDLNGTQREGEEWRFLGIGGQFVELARPGMLEE